MKWGADHSVQALANHVLRQLNLEQVKGGIEAVLALVVLLAQGCLTRLRVLRLCRCTAVTIHMSVTAVHLQSLKGALQAPGALQALEELRVGGCGDGIRDSGMVGMIAQVLTSDVAPSLRILEFHTQIHDIDNYELKAVAAMLEARAKRPACRKLERLVIACWDEPVSGRQAAALHKEEKK